MTGSSLDRSFLVRCIAAITIALLALSVALIEPAAAGSNYRKNRAHTSKRARSQKGTPYKYGGTTPNGFDCSGFTQWTYKGIKVSLPHNSTAQFDLGKRASNKRIWKRKKLEVGDLVFHDTGSGRIGHAGIYIGKGRFISSTSSSGVRVDSLYDSYWGPRWVGATRLPKTMRFK